MGFMLQEPKTESLSPWRTDRTASMLVLLWRHRLFFVAGSLHLPVGVRGLKGNGSVAPVRISVKGMDFDFLIARELR